MISASSLRNFMLNDPIIDWLNLYHQNSSTNFSNYYTERGEEFEKSVVKYMKERYGSNFVDIGGDRRMDQEKYELTLRKMKELVPVIYQGVLINEENQTYGIPDLLIRNDWFNKIIDSNGGMDYHLAKRTKHYVVVDIKLGGLKLKADGITLLNSGNVLYYKAQLYIYNEALSKMQGYNPQKAYILGAGWRFTKNNKTMEGDNCLSKMGMIDYEGVDSFVKERVRDGLEWIRRVRSEEAKGWTLYPPSVPELRPNMSNIQDGNWGPVKQEIATKQEEITLLWRCGPKRRKIANENGVNSWKECDSTVVDFKNEDTARTLDETISTNLSNRPKKPKLSEQGKELLKKHSVEIYLDYETLSADPPFDCIPYIVKDTTPYVFQIGYGIVKDGVWSYKTYLAEGITREEERENMEKFVRDLKELGDYKLYCWGTTEKNHFIRIMGEDTFPCVDLLNLFRKEPITVKGVFDFSLKNIAKGMYKNGQIKSTWEDGMSGLSAMIKGRECYEILAGNGLKMSQMKFPIMEKIIKYNEMDCKTMWEIVEYLRN